MATSLNLREELPPDIVKGANLEKTMDDLFNNFKAGEERNAELVNEFFNQTYFKGEESLINKFTEIKPTLKFDDIKNESINLAILLYENWNREFNNCLSKISNNEIKKAIIKQIHDKVQNEIGTGAPYNHFDDPSECAIPRDSNVLAYIQKVVDYLSGKESASHGKKTIEILKNINITNEEINSLLSAGDKIPTGIELTDPTVPTNTKNDFDTLLSFEIGKEADRTNNIAREFFGKVEGLFTNTFPAINTIISENDEYKYDESKLGAEYERNLQAINGDPNLGDTEKEKQIDNLRWGCYLKYLKTKNDKIGKALEQLYNNDFDYSKLEDSILKDYIDKVVDIRLKMLFNSGLKDVIKVDFGNLDEFKSFCKDLANPTKTNISLNDVNLLTGGTIGSINIPVKKSIIEGPNPRLKKDITQFGGTEKSYDALPIHYEIKKTDIDSLDITIEDKTKLLNFLSRFEQEDKYIIEGKDVGILFYLFFTINNRFKITEFKSDDQKKIQDLFGEAKDSNRDGGGEEDNPENENELDDSTNPENNEEGNEKSSAEKFKEEIEKRGPGKFENGSEIWLPMGDSELPGAGYQWMKIKISNIDITKGTFKGMILGGELKFNSKLEGKSKNFKMDESFFKDLDNISKDSNKIYLQPNPDKSDFNSFIGNLNGRLGTDKLSFPTTGVIRTGNKFTQKITDGKGKEREVEVKYFGAGGDDKSTYKIEYNPIKKSFTVSSTFNGGEKGKNGKSEKKRFSYKRDMDWNNFLIFFNQKGLIPQTEEEAESAIIRQDNDFKMVNGGKWKLNRFSISNVKNVFKVLKGNIKKKIDDYNKGQDEKLEDILIGDRGLYNKLAGVLGFIPSIKGGLGELQQEYYNNRDNRTWKKIERYLKIFQSDPDFGTTFDQVPPFAKILGGKSYKQFITDLARPGVSRSNDDIHKAAALLLANIEKGASPYRGLAGKENSGLWVRVLLGDNHYAQFMRDKQKCINDLKKDPKEKDQIQDVLATCEMDYIINNVNGANGKLGYFGSHEGRGIPGEKGTDYIDNPSKRLLSDQFASKLRGSYKGRFNKSSVEESFGKITHNDFNLAKEDFKRLIKSSRFPGAIANLKKMFLLAKTPEQKSEYQKYFLIYMLGGVLDINGKKDLRKQTYQWAKTMSFLPGMLAKETCHSQKVAMLLDDFCQEEGYERFSKNVKSYFHEGDLKNGKLNIEDLIKEVDARWDVDKMKKFDGYAKSKFPSKTFPENSILKKLQKDVLDSGMENIDNSLLDNPVVANSGGLLSNANVVRDRMAIKDGVFDGRDPDERNNRAEFWKQIAEEVGNMDANSPESVNLVLNQYFSRFGLNSEADRQKAYKRIKTAYYWKDRIGQPFKYDYNGKGQLLDMGNISGEEIEDIVWYTFQGTVWRDCFSSRKLPTEMENALKAFQNFFWKAFNNGQLKKPYVEKNAFKSSDIKIEEMLLGPRNVYKDVFTGDGEYEYDNTEIGDDKDALKDAKKRRKALKRAFQSGRFINHEIAQIEKSFKNRLPTGSYRVITQDTSSDIDARIKWL